MSKIRWLNITSFVPGFLHLEVNGTAVPARCSLSRRNICVTDGDDVPDLDKIHGGLFGCVNIQIREQPVEYLSTSRLTKIQQDEINYIKLLRKINTIDLKSGNNSKLGLHIIIAGLMFEWASLTLIDYIGITTDKYCLLWSI